MTSSFTDTSFGNPPLTSVELSRIVCSSTLDDSLHYAMAGLPTSSMAIRNYQFISHGIGRLQLDLINHRNERESLFQELMERRHFREAIYPVMMEYRRQLSPTPLLRRSPSPVPTSIVADNGVTQLSPESPIPVTIHPLPLDYSDQQSVISSNDSFHTPETEEQGTQTNPIDVDTFEPPPLPQTTVIQHFLHRRTRSIEVPTTCNMCGRRGHTSTTCIWNGPILCNYCREIGHLRDACPDLRRDIALYDPRYQFCVVCNQPGHTVDRCFALLHSQ